MNVLNFIRDVFTLDVEDFSYLYTAKNLQTTLSSRPDIRKRGLLKRIAIFFGHTVQSIAMLPSYEPLSLHRVLFVYSSTNQRRALAPIFDELIGAKAINTGKGDLPMFFAYVLALPFFPLVAFKFLRAKGDQRTAFLYLFDAYWFAYGYYSMVRLLLRRSAPKAVVVANDHVIWQRAFVRAARDEGVPTIYLQHASVTERFPPLAFDYAFLEGIDALEKYASVGPSQAKVFLTGMPKFDAFSNSLNDRDQVRSIGICTNSLDSFSETKLLSDCIKRAFPDLDVILRPHPADKRMNSWREMAYAHEWTFSNGNEEGVFQFLQRVDAIIAGDSSIHLEAALLNVYPLYYAFGRRATDVYGYHRNGLVEYFDSPEALRARIAGLREYRPPVRNRSRFFNATVGTIYDGRSTELILALINQIVNDFAPDLTGWERLARVEQLEAYQPDNESFLQPTPWGQGALP